MKINLKKILFLSLLLCMNFVAFAQLPDPPVDEDPALPIENNLFLLALVGFAFAFYIVNNRIKAKN